MIPEHEEDRFLINLGLRVRQLRRAKDWSQEELAHQCGLHRTYIGGVERGERNISAVNLLRIATAFGISISELFLDLAGE
ncbi:MAG: helix-turn-helix transcriptional regulator [Chloroflexota bacterium]|nr:helix-turn-helix transcriptional regulator [Chloroflexota bacterium]